MKLWRATAEVEVLIASEEEPDVYAITDAAEAEMRDNSGCLGMFSADLIEDHNDIPKEWRGSIPRGDAKGTCEQILDAYLEAERERKLAAPCPGQKELPLEA